MATAAEIEDLMTGPLVTWVRICDKYDDYNDLNFENVLLVYL